MQGIAFPQPVQQQPVFNVGPLMNDNQLIALVAAFCPETTACDRVGTAMDIIAEAVAQQPNLAALIRKKQADRTG